MASLTALLINIFNSGIDTRDPRSTDRMLLRRMRTLNGYALGQTLTAIPMAGVFCCVGNHLNSVSMIALAGGLADVSNTRSVH